MKNLIFLLLISIISCEKNKENLDKTVGSSIEGSNEKFEQNDSRQYYTVNKQYYPLITKAINQGDTISYDAVSRIVDLEGGHIEFFYYSLLMANKHNYSKACYDVYYILNKYKDGVVNHVNAYSFDNETQRLANYYLLKASELGYKDAKYQVKEIFGEDIPNSNNYLCQMKK